MKKKTEKNYKVQIDMDSLIQRVSNQLSLLEADYPFQIIKADTPQAMQRGEAASQAIKKAVSGALPDKKSLSTDLSKAFSATSQRDFISSPYSKSRFFTNLTQIGSRVSFIYFVTSKGAASEPGSVIESLSNYYPVFQLDSRLLTESEVPARIYKFLTESNINTEIYKNIVLLPNAGSGYYYRINPELYMAIGTPGNYQDFISSVNVPKAQGSAELIQFARSSRETIRESVVQKLRSNGVYDILNKHPLFSTILNNSYVLQDSITAGLVDFLNINSMIAKGAIGRRFPETIASWLIDPHSKFYSDMQYITTKVEIPASIKDPLTKDLKNSEAHTLTLKALIPPNVSLSDILSQLSKLGTKTIADNVQSIFTRMALTLGAIKKVAEDTSSSMDSTAAIAHFISTGLASGSAVPGNLSKTSYFKVVINPASKKDTFALFLEASGFVLPEKMNLPEKTSDLISREKADRIVIKGYETLKRNLGLDIPMSIHKWIIATIKKEGSLEITSQKYREFVSKNITEKASAVVGGTAGKDILNNLIDASFDAPSESFTKVVDKKNILPPEFLFRENIKIFIQDSNEFLTEFVAGKPTKYHSVQTLDLLGIDNKKYEDGTITTRPIFIARANTPLAINLFDLKSGSIDPVLLTAIISSDKYKSTEELRNLLIHMSQQETTAENSSGIRELLNVIFRSCVLGYYGDETDLFLETAYEAESNKITLVNFAPQLSDGTRDSLLNQLKNLYGQPRTTI